jgi:hypothetical protein
MLPMNDFLFFKYRAVNKFLIDTLVKSNVYCALPAQFNDPFDCQIDIRMSALSAVNQLTGFKKKILETISQTPQYFDAMQSRMKKIGVCSFSLTLTEPVMWSHYADNHRGVCLLYQFTEDFFQDRRNQIVSVTDLIYGGNPLSDWFIEQIPDQIGDKFYEEFTTELLKRVLMVKGPAWEYEKEARIIREIDGPFEIPRECLKQVCFGLNTSLEDERLVREIVSRSGFSVTYCKIRKGESGFGIEAVET